MLGWLRIIGDSQPKQISPQSRQANAHISNIRQAATLPLLMFRLDFSTLIFSVSLPLGHQPPFFFSFFRMTKCILCLFLCLSFFIPFFLSARCGNVT